MATTGAIARMVGEVQLHDAAAELAKLRALGADLQAVRDERRARCRIAAAPFDLDEAQPTGSECLERVGRAELGDIAFGQRGGPHDRRAFRHRDGDAVDLERDALRRLNTRGAEIGMVDRMHVGLRLLGRLGFEEVLPEVLQGALDRVRRHSAKAAQGPVDHGIAQLL
jgi:hypothetical protein